LGLSATGWYDLGGSSAMFPLWLLALLSKIISQAVVALYPPSWPNGKWYGHVLKSWIVEWYYQQTNSQLNIYMQQSWRKKPQHFFSVSTQRPYTILANSTTWGAKTASQSAGRELQGVNLWSHDEHLGWCFVQSGRYIVTIYDNIVYIL
jgi:hypothetical protein